MKLYVAARVVQYEGYTVLGVFSTLEAAEHVCDEDHQGDWHAVWSTELDRLVPREFGT